MDHMTFWLKGLRCFAARGGGGGGAGGGSGGGSAGATGDSAGGAGGGDIGGAAGAEGGPTPVTLADDALIQLPGMDKPVKFGEWKSGFVPKNEFESVSAQHKAYKDRVLSSVQEYLRQISAAKSRGAEGAPKPSELDELLGALEGEPFIDGKTFRRAMTKALEHTGMSGSKTDKVVSWLYQQNQHLTKRLQSIENSRSEETLSRTVQQWLKENEFDPEYYEDLVMDLFSAYEGKPAEVFDIAKKRIERIEAGRQAKLTKKAQDGRHVSLPGRGGDAKIETKAKSLANASPEKVADELYDLFKIPEG